MKKFLFSLLTVAGSISFVSAQNYTVDMTGNVGASFIIAQDTAIDPTDMSFNTGATGTSNTWSFQGLDADRMDTVNYVSLNVNETAAFPTGNVVNESNIGRVVFNRNPATGLFLMGTALDFLGYPVTLAYNPPQQTLPAVCNVGASSSTSSVVDARIYIGLDTIISVSPGFDCHIWIDTIRIARNSEYSVEFVASGELRLPMDTLIYSLCGLSKDVSTDSILIYAPQAASGLACVAIGGIPAGWSLAPDALIQFTGMGTSAVMHDSTFGAGFYVPFINTPVCLIDFEYDAGYTDTTVNSVRYSGLDNQSIGFEEISLINLNVYPNPASSMVMLQTSYDLNGATMYIYNTQGQQIKVVTLNGTNTIDVSELTNGMYYYQLADGQKLLHQGKLMVKK